MPDSDQRLNELQARWQADPGSRRVFVQLAEEYRRLGRLEEAVSVLEQGLEKAPGYVSAQVALGRCRLEAGETDAAVEVLEEVLSKDATQLVANKLLVEGYLQQGQREDARRRLDLYRQLTGEDPEIEALEQRLEETQSGTAPLPEPPPVPADGSSGDGPTGDNELEEAVELEDLAARDLAAGDMAAQDMTTSEPAPAAREGEVEDEAPSKSSSSEESEPLFPGLSESPPADQSSPEPDPDDTLFDLSGGGDASRHAQQLSQEGLFDFRPPAPVSSGSAAAESRQVEEQAPARETAAPQTAEAQTEAPETASSEAGPSEPQADEPFADLMPPAPVAEEPAAGDDLFQLESQPAEAPPQGDAIFDLSPAPDSAEPDTAEEPLSSHLDTAGPEVAPPEVDSMEAEIPSVEELAASASAPPSTEEAPSEEPAIDDQPSADQLPDLAAEAEAAARELQAEAAAALRSEDVADEAEGAGEEEEPVSATLGQLYLQQGHAEEAERIFRRVLEREPAHPIALAGLETLAKSRASEAAELEEISTQESPIEEGPSEEEPAQDSAAEPTEPEEPEDLAAVGTDGLRAEHLLQGSEAEAVTGLTARKVVLLKNYLQRLRAGT